MTDFGLLLPDGSEAGADLGFAHAASLAATAEESGFASVWVRDRCPSLRQAGDREDRRLEAYTLLGALAARTTRVQLGALVSDVTCRHPGILAKMVTTLDVITGGRAVLALGSPADTDHDGPEPAETGDRHEMLDEAVRICRALFTHDDVSFAGRYFRLDHARNLPAPVRPRGPRILIAADDLDTVLPLAARAADMCGVSGDAGTVARTIEALRRLCGDIGRDPAEIAVTWSARFHLVPTGDGPGPGGSGPAADASSTGAAGAMVGPPDRIPELIADHLAAGVDGVVFSFGSVDAPAVAAVGEALGLTAR